MPTCDDYQLSFEMQLHGAAPVIPTEEITAHIASCTSCTAYVATTEETATMNTANWTEHDGFDAARLLARVKAELNPTLRDRLPGLALAAVLSAVMGVLVVFADYSLGSSALIGGGTAFAVTIWQMRARRQAWAKLAEASAGDLIAARRSDLARRNKWSVVALVFLPVLVALNFAIEDLHEPTVWIETAALGLIIVVAFVQHLRDRREYRELGA